MSQNYNFKSLDIGNDETSKLNSDSIHVFETGETKTIDFIKLDNTRQNFPYTHYLTSWIEVKDGKRILKIIFATHTVAIEGFCLDPIYVALKQFQVKTVKANDERYAQGLDGRDDKSDNPTEQTQNNRPFISSITIEWKGKE